MNAKLLMGQAVAASYSHRAYRIYARAVVTVQCVLCTINCAAILPKSRRACSAQNFASACMEYSDLEHCREPATEDISAMVKITILGIGKYYRTTQLLQHSKARSMHNKHNHFIMQRLGAHVIGFLMYRIEGPHCYIYEIHVDKVHRGAGVGQRLLGALIEKNLSLVLFVHKENAGAIGLYKRNGFVIDNTHASESQHKMVRAKIVLKNHECKISGS